MATNTTTTNGHIESLIDYVLDVKPYHVKLAGGVEEYVFHEDSLTVSFQEHHEMMVVMGPDYTNSSLNPARKVWANAPIRPISTTSGMRTVQSDGARRVYSIPAMLFNKIGSQTGNVFKKTAVSAPTEIPGLNIGLFDTRAFSPNFGTIVGVKVDGVSQVKNQDYWVSKGAFSFVTTTPSEGAPTWKRHDIQDLSQYPENRGVYEFTDDIVKKFGTVKDIVVDDGAAFFEEWRLTYATDTTVNVIGSHSGNIGTATFNVPFVHANISFLYTANTGEELVSVMQEGDEFVITPKNKICIHPDSTDQTWTLMCYGGAYKVFGSLSGFTQDAYVGEWYDNGQIAFKIPKLEAWVFVNGVSVDTAILTDKTIYANCQNLFLDGTFGMDDAQDLDGHYDPLDAVPSVYTVKFREGSPSNPTVHSATVFNNARGYRPGLSNGTAWNDGWLTLKTTGNWLAGDEIKIVLAPEGSQTWFGGYDESMYEWTLYDMGTAERPIPLDMLQPYFPLYHSKDAVLVNALTPGDVVEIEKAQRDYVRLRFGTNADVNDQPDALGTEDGWIPLEYRPNAAVPNFATSIPAYLSADPTVKVFTITQPNVGGKPGLASIEFDPVFFNDFITSSTVMTFEFHQADNYGPKVGVNMTEELVIQVNTVDINLFLDGSFNLDGSELLDGHQVLG